MMKLVHELVN